METETKGCREDCVIGIDPGHSGAIVVLDMEGNFMDQIRLSKDSTEIRDFLRKYHSSCKMIVCEKVKYISGDGGKGAFTFGKEFGKVITILETLGFRIIYAIPTLWRTRLNVPLGASKSYLRELARTKFPGSKINLKNCDAFLIALFARSLIK